MKNYSIKDIKLTFNSNKKEADLQIKGFFLDSKDHEGEIKSKFLLNKAGESSLISSENTLYLCLGKKSEYTSKKFDEYCDSIWTYAQNYKLDFLVSTFVSDKVPSFKVLNHFMRFVYLCLTYQPFSYKTKKDDAEEAKIKGINLVINEKEIELQKIFNKNLVLYQNVIQARNWQDMAPNDLNSETMAKQLKNTFVDLKSVKVEVLNKKDIQKENMNLLLSVNAGSMYEPRVVVLKYFNDKKNKKDVSVLLGKGIMFDTGGYSLKPSNYQLGMKYDMSGAAIVCAALKGIAELDLPVNVIAIACLTDNLIGKTATLVESVIKSKNGKTVEITNTDAEGRLILADGITYAIEKFKPKEIIELSTLTGAIEVALGTWTTGAFSNNEDLYKSFSKATKWCHEPTWLLPVSENNYKNMKSEIADLKNSSKGYKGGSSNAAAFLFNFAEKTPFLHLDIAGTATNPDNTRGTGVMVRSLITFYENQIYYKK